MLTTNNSKKQGVISTLIFLFFTILAVIIYVSISTIHPHEDVGFFSDYGMRSLEEGWTFHDGDKTYDVTLPTTDRKIKIETAIPWLEIVLPDDIEDGYTLLIRSSLQKVKYYIDGELRYTYGYEDNSGFGHYPGSVWLFVNINKADAGKILKVEFESPYDDYKNSVNTIHYGTYKQIATHLFHKYIFSFTLLSITILIGISLLIYCLSSFISKVGFQEKAFYSGLAALSLGLYQFTECKLTQILVTNIAGFSPANFMIMAFIPIPTILYVDALENHRFRKIFKVFMYILEANMFIQMFLVAIDKGDFFNMAIYTHALIVVSALIVLVTSIIVMMTSKLKDTITFIILSATLAIGAGTELVIFYAKHSINGTVLSVSVFILVIVTAIDSIRTTFHVMEDMRIAREENDAKSSFLANMSHEIRTPMNAITALSELLVNSSEISKGDRDFAETINSSAKNLLDIINDILDFSKISANRYDIIEDNYELGKLIYDVKEIIGVKASEKKLDFFISIDPDLPHSFYGDINRIRQILLNILNNAVKYTTNGSVTLKIRGENDKSGDYKLIFDIIDTGDGIKKEDMAGLFEAFVQVDKKKNREKEGTGLGLAISNALAHLMGGEITVESEYGKGSTFTVTILNKVVSKITFKEECKKIKNKVYLLESDFNKTGYIKNLLLQNDIEFVSITTQDLEHEKFNVIQGNVLFYAEDAPFLLANEFHEAHLGLKMFAICKVLERVEVFDECEIIRLPISTADLYTFVTGSVKEKELISFTARNANVMIVDDNVVNLRIMREILFKYGINPVLVSNGEQAIQAMKIKHFDLIFMDHMMPKMDGVECTRHIRELEDNQGKDVKIIALTANAIKGVDKMFKQNGFDGYLSKPVSVMRVGKSMFEQLPKELID